MSEMSIALQAGDLQRVCDPSSLGFDTTADLPQLTEVLGQPRAVAALELGVSMAAHGFNLFALGLPGSGKTTLIRDYLEHHAASKPIPPDLCYVNNFDDSRCPIALRLPAGQAAKLKQQVAALVRELRDVIPRAFESKEYEGQRDKIVNGLKTAQAEELTHLEAHVGQFGFQLVKTPGGWLLAPGLEGHPLTEKELEKLNQEQQEKIIKIREKLQVDVEESLRRLRELEKGARDALHSLERETATFATRHLVDDLRATYPGSEDVLAFLDALQADVVEHTDDFRKDREGEGAAPSLPLPVPADNPFARYEVNVLVDNGGLAGAPVLVESNPTYHNLVGRIEHKATFGGAVTTDFTMVKPGALHRANGGFLIIPARECLLNPYAWEGLKRALKDRAIRIEELGAQLSLISTLTLQPEPVPLDVKVVLIGSPLIYHMLYAYDEDFQKLFKVKTEFTAVMDRTPDAEQAYGLFISTITHQDEALPFDRGAVARVVEYGSRLAEDQDKLSTRFGEIADLIREAAHQAAQNSHGAVTAEDVKATEAARRYRQNLIEERLQESVEKGTVLIATQGAVVGQINGLSVLSLGDYAFGHPSRITAAVGPGRRGVVSIEREVELSGPIHGKGVLILGGLLTFKYGQVRPVSLSASLVFEQSYGMVEGDSASLAEFCALLSALSGVPLRQDIAVTGSINQHGQVQPIGGASEKIEGFFDACQATGLTGTQGVLIPARNRRHLMLRDDVVEAVRAGQFHVWTAERVDDGLSLLTNLAPGEPDDQGLYPEGTLHRLVADRLTVFGDVLKELSSQAEHESKAS
jgi:lon-related putative ATP-dependent protease